MRKPSVVAIANFLLPGLGYVLLGRRSTFGWFIMLGVLVQFAQLCIDPLPYFAVYGSTALSVTLGTSTIVILATTFACDAYALARVGAQQKIDTTASIS